MKVLLINPNWSLDKFKYTMAVLKPYNITPLELCNIAGGIDKKHKVEIYDAYSCKSNWQETSEYIRQNNPDVCIISTAPNYLFWRCCPLELSVPKKLIKIIRQVSSSKTILIGPHGTITPEFVLKECGSDYLIKGECDIVTSQLINNEFKETNTIPGVCTKNSISSKLAIVNNLDEIPLPRLDLLDLRKYDAQIWLQKFKKEIDAKPGISILAEASRGCPRHCIYCQRELFRDKYREKSSKRMIEEIEYYKKLGVKFIYFIDETGSLVTPEKISWLKVLENSNIKFGVEATIDQSSREVIDLFKKSGCIYLEFGLESSDKELLNVISKNQNLENLSYARSQIKNIVCFEMNFYTKDYIEILKIEHVNKKALFNRPIIPYPGSVLGKLLLKKYSISKENTWNFILRYTWWLQVEFFLIENKIKKNGFNERYFKTTINKGIKDLILNAPISSVKDLVYSILDLSAFWANNSSGFRDEN